jgi:uncharacterized protein involved in outer membrane biogenesis
MSIWKSPVFYFGVLLATAVVAALIAPFLVNWDSYKPQLEDYGQQLTGREVVIAGDVDARLFPWPRLTATNVIVANEEGFNDAPLLAADVVTARFSLAGLVNGSFQVEEIEFDAPQLNLVRAGSGAMNWTMHPAAGLQGLLSRVKLDRITIRNGGVWFEDKQRKQGSSLTGINAALSAEELEGPWRLIGSGQWRDTLLNLNFSTGAYKPGEGLRLALTATPDDAELPVFSMDGLWRSGEMKGQVKLSGQEGGSGKGSIQDKLRPLTLQSDFVLMPMAAQFTRIKIAPADKRDSGTLIEGQARVDLTSGAKANIALEAPRVNLDTLLGAGSLARWRSGGLLAVANSIFTELPEAVEAQFALDVSVITAGGETFNDVSLKGLAERAAIRINSASAQLPGRSRVKFDGVIFPNAGGAQLGGALVLDTPDFRGLTGWLLPGARQAFADSWKGSRGRLKLESRINWTPELLALEKAAYELDGLPGAASLAWRFGDVPLVSATIDTPNLDLDTYVQGSEASRFSANPFALMALLPQVLDLGQIVEHHIKLATDNLTLNGASAQGVRADYVVGLSGLEVKALEFATTGGATFKGEGLVINGTDGPVGEINFSLKADDVSRVLQLAGLGRGEEALDWQDLLGQTDASFTVAMDAEQARPRVNIKSKGTSGQLAFVADATLRDLGRKQGALTAGRFEITARDAAPVLRTLGLAAIGDTGPLQAKAVLDGDETAGFDSDVTVGLLGTTISYKGKLQPKSPFWGVDGAIAAEAPSLLPWIAATTIPAAPEGDSAFRWHGKLHTTNAGLSLQQEGEAMPPTFKAGVTLDAQHVLSADIELEKLTLGSVLSWAFMPWRGPDVDLQDSFSNDTWLVKAGQIFLKPKVLDTGLGRPVREAMISLAISTEGRDFSIKVPGKTIDMELKVKPQGASFEISGHGRMEVDLASTISLDGGKNVATGTMIFEGDVSSKGRSPAAALQAMQGKGAFWLEGGSLSAITVNGFGGNIASVATPPQLTSALAALEAPTGTPVPAQTGALTIRDGIATTAAITMANKEETLAIEPQLDLSTQELTVKADVQSALRSDLPPVTFTYAGPPDALRLRKGSAALAGKLGHELMSIEMAKLEKLQREEQAILKREEQQRLEDQQRFDAYQLQRAELRQRQRELRFHEVERERLLAQAQQELRKAIAAGDAANRQELALRIREIAIRRFLNEPLPEAPLLQVPVLQP